MSPGYQPLVVRGDVDLESTVKPLRDSRVHVGPYGRSTWPWPRPSRLTTSSRLARLRQQCPPRQRYTHPCYHPSVSGSAGRSTGRSPRAGSRHRTRSSSRGGCSPVSRQCTCPAGGTAACSSQGRGTRSNLRAKRRPARRARRTRQGKAAAAAAERAAAAATGPEAEGVGGAAGT